MWTHAWGFWYWNSMISPSTSMVSSSRYKVANEWCASRGAPPSSSVNARIARTLPRPFRQLVQVGPGHRPIGVGRVHHHVTVEIQLQPVDVLHQRGDGRADPLAGPRDVEVPGKEDALARKQGDQHGVGVFQVVDVMQLQDARLVLEHQRVDDALDLRLLAGPRQHVADERPRFTEGGLDEELAVVVGDHGDAFGDEGRQAANVVEMRM